MGHAEVPFRDDTGWARMPKPLEAVNDFVVKFANVNGSGSASANGLFAKSVLRMGVPASSRNIFPSNIQGLPTWYEVRISEGGHLGRRGGVDMMVAMNPETWDEDIAEIEPGGYLLYDSTKPLPKSKFREDIFVIGAPLTAICNRAYDDPRQRQLFKNIVYLGVLSALLDMDVAAIEELIGEQFRGKDTLIKPNVHALHLGRDWAQTELACPIGLRLERRDKVGERIFVTGNDAAALGAVYGGATGCAWCPITPSSSLAEALDLADRLQTPVFVMLDLDIGMNEWLIEPLSWDPDRKYDRGKVMNYEMLEAGAEFGRYLDVDSDGIPYRTLPGTHPTRGAFFTRGTTKDEYARYTEEGRPYVANMQRLLRKFETAKRYAPRPVKREAREPTRFGAIYFGSTTLAMEEALETLETRGIHLDTLRIRSFPFHDEVFDFVASHERLFVVEQNRDSQMRSLLTIEGEVDPARLVPILHYDGTPITARFIVKAVAAMLAVLTLPPPKKALP